MMNRYYEWQRRVMTLQLGIQGDIWRLVPQHPATDWVRDKLTKRGGTTAADDDVAYYLNRSLIQDVLHAAGTVEYTTNKIYTIATAIEDYVENELRLAWPDKDLEGVHILHPLVDHLYIEWNSLLEKLRTLMDRVRSTEPGIRAKRGLIPALKPDQEPRRRIETAFDRVTKALESDRLLANYSLHLHALPNPTATVKIEKGRVVFPIPDAPTEPVYIFDQLAWDAGRDVLTFTRDRMAVIEKFINEILAAFEAAAGTNKP